MARSSSGHGVLYRQSGASVRDTGAGVLKNKHKNMTTEQAKKGLGMLFTTSKRESGEEYIHYTSEAMKQHGIYYPIYEAVNNAAYDSGLSFEFSYEIASRAADILAEAEDWENDNDMTKRVDNACPIYINEIMNIYASDSWAVDEAQEEIGDAGDSTKRAQQAWYLQTQAMVGAIKNNLAEVIEHD